jgi:hypothetical protein
MNFVEVLMAKLLTLASGFRGERNFDFPPAGLLRVKKITNARTIIQGWINVKRDR